MRKTNLFFAAAAAILLLSCGSTGKFAKSAEKAEIKEIDGSFIISNRDSSGNPFVTENIYIANQTSYGGIAALITGEDADKKNTIIFNQQAKATQEIRENLGGAYAYSAPSDKGYKKIEKQNSGGLSQFEKIYIMTLNGKITGADIRVKNRSLYITIKGYDRTQLSELVRKADEKVKEEQREKEKQRQEKIDVIKKEALSKGKSLYEQKILAGQTAKNPIIVGSYRTKMDAVGGVEVFISFFNNSGKTLKYVDFEVTPYNRVDDIARSTIGGTSTTTIQVVNYIGPSKKYDAHFPPVWYNNTISYIKINSIKVMFEDGSTAVIPQKDISTVFKSPELSFKLQNFGDISLSLVYNIPDKRLFIRSDKKGGGSLGNYEIDFVFDTDVRTVSLGFPRAWFNSDSITREYQLDDVLISAVRSGYMTEHDSPQMTPRIPALDKNASSFEENAKIFLTDDELRQIRDFACIRYYAENLR